MALTAAYAFSNWPSSHDFLEKVYTYRFNMLSDDPYRYKTTTHFETLKKLKLPGLVVPIILPLSTCGRSEQLFF